MSGTDEPVAVHTSGVDAEDEHAGRGVEAVPYKAEHFFELIIQHAQRQAYKDFTAAQARELENQGTMTIMRDGKPIAVAGAMKHDTHRAEVWSFIGSNVGAVGLLLIVRWLRRYLEVTPYKRLEAHVDLDFTDGHRLLKLAGFSVEKDEQKWYYPNGHSATLYVFIKD